jgi:hypothetical protein
MNAEVSRAISMIEFEPLTVAEARSLLKAEAPPVYHKATDPFKALRRREAPVALERYAQSWMALLPLTAQLPTCAVAFPRIVNTLAALWDNPEKGTLYLKNLLSDTRENRRGFPPLVRAELEALRTYRNSFRTVAESTWTFERLDRF